MKNIVTTYLNKFKQDRSRRLRLGSVVLVLALAVAVGIGWKLRYTGIALTNETYCGLTEHTHTDDCYEQVLVCDLEECEGHTHTDDCYEETSVLICGQEEYEGHTHTEECYGEVTTLICAQEEGTGGALPYRGML
ncbi:MAG: hypothetical protein LUI87_09410 [Lachnospiraceae bacterium]|nr:hypothetical protein [Lachnospiraceae bacterium]